MSEPIISVSGLRGTIGDQLTPAVAMRYVSALAATLPPGKVVIGRDGRASGPLLAQVVSATLQGHGLDVVDLGPAATPTIGVEVRNCKAVAGIQISASHNPVAYNGLKLFGPAGRVLPKTDGEQVLEAYKQQKTKWVPVEGLGSAADAEHPHSAHLAAVHGVVEVDSIREKKFKVLLDSNHGAGAALGRLLLESFGCEVTVLGEEPHGQFAHKPEPLAENLQGVSEQVAAGGYDVVFCQDPDADRLAIIDEKGAFIGEELTLALCLLDLIAARKAKGLPTGNFITNCATSSVSKVLAEQSGYTHKQSAVGEANVADLMIAEDACFGGEGNGGPIDPEVGYVRDSFVGMARTLSLLARTGKTVSALVAELPKFSMVKDKVDLAGVELPVLLDKLESAFGDAHASRPDGLKLQWEDRWLLVRGSNTEPIVRFIAEAPSTEEAQALCDRARASL